MTIRLILGGCLMMGILSCNNASDEQGNGTNDTADHELIQEGPQSAHTPLNEPENRSSVADTTNMTDTGNTRN